MMNSRAKNFWENKRGMTLITTFVFMMTMAMMVSAFLNMSAGETRELKGRIDTGKAFWFAEAGAHKAIWMIITPPAQGGGGKNYQTPAGGVTETLDDGSYNFVVTKKGSNRNITSRGSYQGIDYLVKYIVQV